MGIGHLAGNAAFFFQTRKFPAAILYGFTMIETLRRRKNNMARG